MCWSFELVHWHLRITAFNPAYVGPFVGPWAFLAGGSPDFAPAGAEPEPTEAVGTVLTHRLGAGGALLLSLLHALGGVAGCGRAAEDLAATGVAGVL